MSAADRKFYFSDERYVAALRRIRALIAGGVERNAYDCNVTGMKDTSCSWGLCSNDKEAWPDAEDHLWPDLFAKHGRIAPKYFEEHQVCPMRKNVPHDGNGCFYHCSVFQRKSGNRPNREQALARYDATIAKALGEPSHAVPATGETQS